MTEAATVSIETLRLLERGREPLPPFTHNVYIAHSLEDSTLVSGEARSLCRLLIEKYNFKCFPRHLEGENSTIKMRIDEGVWSSEKCLILLTDSYRADESSHYEIQQIQDKAKRYSSDLVIVVLLTPHLSDKEFKDFDFYIRVNGIHDLESLCNDGQQLSMLAQSINNVPDANLACLPKVNVGYGAATGFFYGFLRLVLPDFRERFRKAAEEDVNAVPGMIERSVCKMIIILPLSCFCPTTIYDMNGRITNVDGLYVKRWANRAGNIRRDYKSSVYKLVNETTHEEYYFAGELATPLLTMYESYCFGLFGMTLPQLYRERDAFCFTLHQILNHPNNRQYNNQYRLIMWDDRKDDNDGNINETLYERLLPVLQEELEQDRLERENSSSNPLFPAAGDEYDNEGENMACEIDTTFEILHENVQSMTAIYERTVLPSYTLREGVRGKALIINIVNFQAHHGLTANQLHRREGGQHDGENIQKLFEDLGFETDVHDDVNRHRLESILMMYNRMDHSNYDAFIFCIMTHGNLGEIYTSDSLPYRILDIVDMFSSTNCPSLRGKPKLFFVQSCQKGTEPESASGDNSALEMYGALQGKLETDADLDNGDDAEGGLAEETFSTIKSGIGGSESGYTSPSEAIFRDKPELKALLVPGEPDILMSYSALPGSISFRDPHRGSLYIEALAVSLKKSLEMDRALKIVTEYVGARLKEHMKQQNFNYVLQQPFHLTTGMSKLLLLTPVNRKF